MDKSIYLHGIALANFRGIGKETMFLGPFSTFNFLIGPNNSGKSSTLIFIDQYLPSIINGSGSISLKQLDIPTGGNPGPIKTGFALPKSSVRNDILERFPNIKDDILLLKFVDQILDSITDDGLIWLRRGNQKPEGLNFDAKSPRLPTDPLLEGKWRQLWQHVSGRSGGGLHQHWIPESLSAIIQAAQFSIPAVSLIPAIREISPKGEEFKDWTGAGLIEELARLQNPGYGQQEKRNKFQRINQFLKSVSENETAFIEIPYEREHVLVHMDNKILPLEALGTGIHEVVMLAAFCTLMEKQIVCIEEPEIHLHPVLQRRLIRYLQENTSNQYFIATHSPGIIDTQGAAVFHVTNSKGETIISRALTPNSKFAICRDLGYKASDLLQANAIIWVEGPSDRIYLRHWINLVDPELREGSDYTIMFYGGRLLSHLQADDIEVAENDVEALIAVRQLNRNIAVVMDSDKAKKTAGINETKTRITDELAKHGGIGWVTEGREIENYVPIEIMTEALQEIYHKKYHARLKTEKYDNVLPFKTKDGSVFKDPDKVKIAKSVCAKMNDINLFDLRERVSSIVDMIKDANK